MGRIHKDSGRTQRTIFASAELPGSVLVTARHPKVGVRSRELQRRRPFNDGYLDASTTKPLALGLPGVPDR
jgi:hypothetical protein